MTALDDLCALPFHQADSPARARVLSRLADTELAVALEAEPAGEEIAPRLFTLEAGPVALACDGEDRLAGFLGGPTPYAAMPGRVLAGLLHGAGLGLLVNPGQRSEMLLDTATLGWLVQALAPAPAEDSAALGLVAPAATTAGTLAGPLAERLADLRGLAAGAALAGVAGADPASGPRGHVLLIAGAAPDRQPAIAKALAEALAFLPPQPGGVDVAFAETPPPPGALVFDLSLPAEPAPTPRAPGPPILR